MKPRRPGHRAPSISAFLLVVALLVPTAVSAELYKYRTGDGQVLITTEKRSDLQLIEILSGDATKKAKRTATKRTRKRSPKVSPNAPTTPRGQNPISRLPWAEREVAFDDIIREASEAYDVPFAFIKAVIRTESAFKPDAVSHAGAMGLMQLMPKTAASLNVTDPFSPRQNIFGGAKFLRILIDRYDGDINLILAAYNAGDAAVARYDGIPYPQTRGYVAAVYQWYQTYSQQEE